MKLPTIVKILIIADVLLLIALSIGMIQNHYNKQLPPYCKEFKTYTEYKGYHCPGGQELYTKN